MCVCFVCNTNSRIYVILCNILIYVYMWVCVCVVACNLAKDYQLFQLRLNSNKHAYFVLLDLVLFRYVSLFELHN